MGLGAGCQCCALLLFFSALDAAPGHQKQEDALCTAVMRPLQLTSAKQGFEHCCCLYSVVFRAVSVDVGKVVRKDTTQSSKSLPVLSRGQEACSSGYSCWSLLPEPYSTSPGLSFRAVKKP